MNVDTMRAVDHYAGVPLCFLVSGIKRLFGRKNTAAPVKNVLLVELSEMGSAIIVDPAMRKLQKKAGANLHFVIFKKNKASLELLKTVPADNIFTIREDSLFALAADTLRFLAWCRKRKIDTVIDLELFSRFTALLTGLSGAKNTVGFHRFHMEGLYRGEMLTKRVAYNPHIHIAKNFIALMNAAMSGKDETPYSKTLITDDEIRLAKAVIDPALRESLEAKVRAAAPHFDPDKHRIILINPNASELLPQRRWMRDRYAETMKMILAEYPDVFLYITGAPAEKPGAEELKQMVGSDRCINFAGGSTMMELLPLYERSLLMVTNDSGPAHFASVTEMPTVVIFGPETPALYGSLGKTRPIFAGLACSPCVSAANHRKTPCKDNVCLQAITPDQVFAAVKETMAELGN